MSRTEDSDFANEWLLRNWRKLSIVVVGIVFATVTFRAHNWTLALALSAMVIGVALNIFVMIVNRGKMPAATDDIENDEPNHQAMHDETRFRVLGDWIPLAGWLISPGDVLLYVGLVGFLLCQLTQGR